MDALRPCPDSALLAAFIDGTLGDYERTAVVSHLSECPQCRAVALTVVEFRELTASDEQWHTVVAPAPAPLGETGVRRWARAKTRAPALALAAAATIAAVVVPVLFILSSWSARQSVSIPADAINSQRPIEARISEAGSYAPPPSTLSSPDPSRNWQLVAAANRVRATNQNDYGARSRTALGVAALLAGDLDDAVASLTIATAAKPDDSQLANHLAAAYYERSQRGSRPDDLPAALGAAERAVTLDDTFAEAWFNRALIITALGMHAEARTAWQVFLSKDPSSPWSDEARSRLQALPRATAIVDWAELRRHLLSDITRDSAERAVATHSGRARDLFENVLLKGWLADAKLGRDTTATGHRLSVLADAFEAVNQDRFYRDVVISLGDVERLPHRRAALVRAYEDFFSATALAGANLSAEAAVAFRRADTRLTALGDPYASRARVEEAATAFSRKRYREAEATLVAEKDAARVKRYRSIATRAAWLLGMTQFGLNDLAGARVHYEEMLESSGASADADVYVMANVLLANLHDALGDNPAAWRYRVEASSRVEDCYTKTAPINVFVSAAGHALARGHLDAALLFQSRLLGGESYSLVGGIQARTQRASVLHRLNQTDAALRELQAARTQLARLPASAVRAGVEADLLVTQSELLEADKNAALALAERAVAIGGRGADLLRRARLQMRLAETALASGYVDRADRAAADAITAIDQMREAAPEQLTAGASDQALSLYSRATEIALRRGDLARAFDYSERGRIRNASELRSWSTGGRRLQTIQGELASDTALAVFTQVGDKLQVWIVRRTDVGTHRIELTAQRAAGLVAAHLDEMNRGISSPAMTAELYDTIFRPVQGLLAGVRNIVVVADAPYSRIAFAGLWDRHSDRYLIEDHQLVSSASATAYLTTMARNKGRRAPPSRSASMVLATASSMATGGAGETFVASLGSAYPGGFFTVGNASTPVGVLRELAQRDVVHIAAAMAPNEQFPERSRLLMDDEPGRRYSGSMSASQLAGGTAVRARLVTLDAGGDRGGDISEGISGFATALLAKGVSSVVGPVALVPKSNLQQTWLDFHRHYAAGTTAAESLRRAQLAALDESNRRTGPWATLAVFGSTE